MSLTFDEIVERVRNWKVKPTHDEYLEFYGYYKQATVGDCNVEPPSEEEPIKRALWQSWKDKTGLTLDDAKAYYIKVYEKFGQKYDE